MPKPILPIQCTHCLGPSSASGAPSAYRPIQCLQWYSLVSYLVRNCESNSQSSILIHSTTSGVTTHASDWSITCQSHETVNTCVNKVMRYEAVHGRCPHLECRDMVGYMAHHSSVASNQEIMNLILIRG